jgi:hypothetical protein
MWASQSDENKRLISNYYKDFLKNKIQKDLMNAIKEGKISATMVQAPVYMGRWGGSSLYHVFRKQR